MIILIIIGCAFILPAVELQENNHPLDPILYLKTRLANNEMRIIGGADVAPHAYPFQGLLLITHEQDVNMCGGTLISPRWILTAAHCVDGNPRYIYVILGAHNFTADILNTPNLGNQSVQTFRSTSYIKHSKYNKDTLVNDIAMVKLPKNATLNMFVGIVPISKGTDMYVGKRGIILGWGKTDDGNVSETLKSVTVEVMANEACRMINPAYRVVTQNHVCVSGDGIKGSCGGDSGGPLLVNGTQIGVVSFGPENCTLGMPSVFTRLNRYNQWIFNNINSAAELFSNTYALRFILVILALLYSVVFV